MKKLIAIFLSLILVVAFSVTAFAAQSPVAKEQVTVVLRKAGGIKGVEKDDVKYTLDGGTEITVVADEAKYGTFNNWTIYKAETEATTTATPVGGGIMTLSAAVLNLATKTTTATAPADYEIVKGSLTSKELTILTHSDLIICGNYNNKVTDPASNSTASGTDTDESPKTGDVKALCAVIVMLASAAVVFGVKKQLVK